MNTARILCTAVFLSISSVGLAADNAEFGLRGETKSQVRSEYGEPESIKGPVGDPPITRWIYPGFSVVYEYDRVLHAFKRQPALENQSADAYPSRPDRSGQGDTLDIPE